MLTIQIIGISCISVSNPAAADIFPWYTYAVTQTVQIRGIMTTETYL